MLTVRSKFSKEMLISNSLVMPGPATEFDLSYYLLTRVNVLTF